MARIWGSGWELNTNSNGLEWGNAGTSSITISGTTLRSGAKSGQVTGMSSGNRMGPVFVFASANSNGPFYFRFYLRISTAPSAANTIFSISDTFQGTMRIGVKLTNGLALQLFDEDGQVGSDSSALASNVWYRIEVKYDLTAAAGSHVAEGKIDGTVFATASNRNISIGSDNVQYGGNLNAEAQTTGVWFFDDVSINDATGSFQNSYAGAGRITHYIPTAAGDANLWTRGGTDSGTNWGQVDDVPPNDISDYNQSTTLNDEDLFNISDTGNDLGSGDTVNAVVVGVRFRSDNAASSPSFKLEIESSSGGTIEQSSSIATNTTTWTTNINANPHSPQLVLYDLPGASTAVWTKATLDTAQIGYKLSVDDVNNAQISAVWLQVDFTPLIDFRNLTTGTDVDGNSTATTASVTPLANTFYLLSVASRTGITADPNQPTVTSTGLTWAAINTIVYDDTSSSRRRLTLFRAMGSSPSAGTLAIDFAAQNQTDVDWSLEEVTGTDTTGSNGSGAVVQSATALDDTATVATLTASLGAFASVNNATFGVFANGNGLNTSTAGTGFVKLGEVVDSNNDIRLVTESKAVNDTSVDITFSGISELGGIAIEIKPPTVAVSNAFAGFRMLMGAGL